MSVPERKALRVQEGREAIADNEEAQKAFYENREHLEDVGRRSNEICLGGRRLPIWVVCHERSRSKRRRTTIREMKEGPSGSAIRC